MSRAGGAVDTLLAEIVAYGGLPVSRHTAYQLALDATDSRKAADLFAFGPQVRALPGEVESSMDEAIRVIDG